MSSSYSPEYKRHYYRLNRERILKHSARYRKENRERILERRNTTKYKATEIAYRQAYKAKHPYWYKKWKLRQYGLTLEQFEELLRAQNNRCRICSQEFSTKGRFRPCVDHCHSVGHVRGLLCQNCNTAIGLLSNSVTRVERLLKYLRQEELFNCNPFGKV